MEARQEAIRILVREAFDIGASNARLEIIKIIEHCRENNYTDEKTVEAILVFIGTKYKEEEV